MKNQAIRNMLTELVRDGHRQCKVPNCKRCKFAGKDNCVYMLIADYLMEHNVSIIRNTTEYLRLPHYSGKVDVTFDSNAIMGTVTLGDESIPVYLASMSAHQILNLHGSHAKKLEPPVKSVKRTFTFIET